MKNYILTHLDQATIFAHYFDLSESDISDCLNFKLKINNPLRNDPRPSLTFVRYGDKIVSRDYGSINHSGDVFQIAAEVLSKNCTNSEDFKYICKDIVDNVGKSHRRVVIDKTKAIVNVTEINIIERLMKIKDHRYFYKYFIPTEVVNSKYIAVKKYSINGIMSSYKYTEADPCYAYMNNPNCFKLYFPFRNKSGVRFISNNRVPIELLHTIIIKDFTILIKGYKDKVLMDYICDLLNIHNIQFIVVSSESAKLNNDIVDLLKKYTLKRIFTMFDLDKCGLDSAYFYKKHYGFDNIFLGTQFNKKDPTDLIEAIKLQEFLKLFKHVYECF